MKVAVVIPCYNVEEHIGSAIRSVLNQTHIDLDIAVVDDGSTDSTATVVESIIAQTGDRVKLIRSERKGACAARNLGMRHTEGEFIQFLDADDSLYPDKIERQIALVLPGTVLVAGGYREYYENGSDRTVAPLGKDPWMALVTTRIGTTSSMLMKRGAIELVGGWNEALASSQDHELLFRIFRNNVHVEWDMNVGCDILKRTTGSISRTDQMGNWLRYIELRRSMRDHLLQNGPSGFEEVIAAADQFLFTAIRVLSEHDRKQARIEFDRTLGKSFTPIKGPANGSLYVQLFKLLGYRRMECLGRIVNRTTSRRKTV